MSGKSTVRIGTCDGLFYCSEVLACVLLKLLPQYRNASIVRSRDRSDLDDCDIVVGVGGMYDHSRRRYDPNVNGFQETMKTVIKRPGYNWERKLSSAGLIYCHFGHEILRRVLSVHITCTITEDTVIEIFKIIYKVLIKEIDAVNCDTQILQMYRSVNTDLSGRVSRLNPLWASQDLNNISCIPGTLFKEQFEKAMTLVREEFLETVQYAKNVWLRVKDTMRRAVESRFEVDSSGEIIMFPLWYREDLWYQEFLHYIERENQSIKYVISESRNGYGVTCISVAPNSSAHRTLLPESWGGLHADDLVEACGIVGALSVSRNRIFGVHKTEDGAMAMARKALQIERTMRSRANRTRNTDNEPQTSKRRALF